MKKTLFLNMLTIVMVAFLSMGLTSCGDDDDDAVSSSSLVGTWYSADDDEYHYDVCYDVAVFTESTISWYYAKMSNGTWKLESLEPDVAAYTLNGNKMTLKRDGVTGDVEFVFHGNTFTVSEVAEGELYSSTYKKFDGTVYEFVNYLNEQEKQK